MRETSPFMDDKIAVVMIHIGALRIPDHFWSAAYQVRKYYSGPLYFILHPRERNDPELLRFPKKNMSVFNSAFIDGNPRMKEFEAVNCLGEKFWTWTCTRLIYLEEFMRTLSIENVVHIENDVLIYESPMAHLSNFKKHFTDKVAINPIGEKYSSFAYGYVDNWQAMNFMNNEIMKLLSRGYDALNQEIGEGMVNEMMLLKIIMDTYPDQVSFLPVLPEGPLSKGIEDFEMIFDCASWGQYIGGLPGGEQKGWTGNHHYVGREIAAGKYDIFGPGHEVFPAIRARYGDSKFGELIRINNLHIHSKQLSLYQ